MKYTKNRPNLKIGKNIGQCYGDVSTRFYLTLEYEGLWNIHMEPLRVKIVETPAQSEQCLRTSLTGWLYIPA